MPSFYISCVQCLKYLNEWFSKIEKIVQFKNECLGEQSLFTSESKKFHENDFWITYFFALFCGFERQCEKCWTHNSYQPNP